MFFRAVQTRLPLAAHAMPSVIQGKFHADDRGRQRPRGGSPLPPARQWALALGWFLSTLASPSWADDGAGRLSNIRLNPSASPNRTDELDTVFGGSLGRSEYFTAAKAYAGIPVLPYTRAELQILSFGTRAVHYQGEAYSRTAWAMGASALAQGHLHAGWSLFGKLGVHYLRSEGNDPAQGSAVRHGFRFGVGTGGLWRFHPDMSLRLELENIGGAWGNVLSAGVQLSL